jgi:hypothetical protein
MNRTFQSELIVFRNDGDIYFGVFESDTFRIAIVIFSTIFSIFLLLPLDFAFLWYDYFGPHSERVIINRLMSSMSGTSIFYFIFVHFIDILRYIYGSLSGYFILK